jgi:hypothetical protein
LEGLVAEELITYGVICFFLILWESKEKHAQIFFLLKVKGKLKLEWDKL